MSGGNKQVTLKANTAGCYKYDAGAVYSGATYGMSGGSKPELVIPPKQPCDSASLTFPEKRGLSGREGRTVAPGNWPQQKCLQLGGAYKRGVENPKGEASHA